MSFDCNEVAPAPFADLLGIRAGCYETGFKVFRRPHTLSWKR